MYSLIEAKKWYQELKAEKALKKAISIDPKFPLSYLNLLQLYENQGNEKKAQELWKEYRNINNQIQDMNILKLDLDNTDKM